MDFELVTIGIEKIERITFASVLLPERHPAEEPLTHRGKTCGLDSESQMGVITPGNGLRVRQQLKTKPKGAGLKIRPLLPSLTKGAAKKIAVKRN